jgi:16S rRNA (uracil1498-N3)-methyltransferase
LILEYLSNIELYFCSSVNNDEQSIYLTNDELHHSITVMRNRVGDILYATDGKGKIFGAVIENIGKDNLQAKISKTFEYENNMDNITFCIPNLKNPERFKFALEKCTELGITSFIFYSADHSVGKGFNLERINKILLASMKQSLRAFYPKIEICKSLNNLIKNEIEVVLFEQTAKTKLSETEIHKNQNYIFLFGPEGGFSKREFDLFSDVKKLRLTENRLRTETAIVKAASMIGY